MSPEEWTPVPDYEGFYEVSTYGRVRSLARTVTGRPGVTMSKPGRLLSPRLTHDGYSMVTLCLNGRRREHRVHRLVLAAFVGPCPNGMEGCHIDGQPSNNYLTNLRWDTRSANTLDKVRHGTHPMAARTHCPAGHAYTEANTYRKPNGSRDCRTCRHTTSPERKSA